MMERSSYATVISILITLAATMRSIRFGLMVTAGATRESMDPVRFITNHSTGKMGFALAKECMSQVGTIYSTSAKGPRYLNLTEGYILEEGLDAENNIIGYKYVNMGKMMDFIKAGTDPAEAIEKASGKYGRFDEAVKKIDPRKE